MSTACRHSHRRIVNCMSTPTRTPRQHLSDSHTTAHQHRIFHLNMVKEIFPTPMLHHSLNKYFYRSIRCKVHQSDQSTPPPGHQTRVPQHHHQHPDNTSPTFSQQSVNSMSPPLRHSVNSPSTACHHLSDIQSTVRQQHVTTSKHISSRSLRVKSFLPDTRVVSLSSR
jgi:hypothetical protein